MLRRATYSPAPGRSRDVLEMLKDRVKHGRSLGLQIGLMTEVIASEGTRYQTVSGVENLAAFEKTRQKIMADPSSVTFFEKIEGILREPVKVELWDSVVPLLTGPTADNYVARQSFFPAPAHTQDFRASLTGLVKQLQSSGTNMGLLWRMFSPDGATGQAIFPMKQLTDWETLLASRTEEVFRWNRLAGAQARKPSSIDLWQGIPLS